MTMSLGLLFVLASLTCYRVTRLIVEDSWPPMVWVRDRIERPEWLAYLFTCGHCMSVWVAAATVGIMWATIDLPVPGVWFGAVAAVTSLLYSVLP